MTEKASETTTQDASLYKMDGVLASDDMSRLQFRLRVKNRSRILSVVKRGQLSVIEKERRAVWKVMS